VVVCQVPKGNWKVMGFYLDPSVTLKQVWRKVGFVDYLDEKAMDAFIGMSYDQFYANRYASSASETPQRLARSPAPWSA
jgi:hypothetical protein